MPRQLKRGLVIFGGLGVFHLSISVLISCIARTTFFSSFHDGQGVWNFALDSNSYDVEALRLFELLKNGDYGGWWGSSFFWHAKWIALAYAIFTPDPLAFAPVNAFIWGMSTVCVYKIVCQLFPDRRTLALFSALVFGLWPSYLLHTTQLLKDPFYILGILMIIWGWVGLLLGRRAIACSLLVGLGSLLACLNRPYIMAPIACLSFLAAVLVFWRARRAWGHALLALMLVLGICRYSQHEVGTQRSEVETQSEQKIGTRPNGLGRYLARVGESLKNDVQSIVHARNGFIGTYPNAGSNIDTEVRFSSFTDIVAYLPRAALIGFLAPFPTDWFKKGNTVGRAGRILAGIEMIGWYFLIIGFLYFLITGPVAFQARLWLSVYCVGLVLLTSLVVTNLGALFRMRFVYFLPILIGGLEYWTRCKWVRRLISYVRNFRLY